jgi:DNA/RNA endonuclease G (NUC1)
VTQQQSVLKTMHIYLVVFLGLVALTLAAYQDPTPMAPTASGANQYRVPGCPYEFTCPTTFYDMRADADHWYSCYDGAGAAAKNAPTFTVNVLKKVTMNGYDYRPSTWHTAPVSGTGETFVDSGTYHLGHMVRRADFSRTDVHSDSTCHVINRVAQSASFNIGQWATMENAVQKFVKVKHISLCLLTYAIYGAGGGATPEKDKSGIAGVQVAIPTHMGKQMFWTQPAGAAGVVPPIQAGFFEFANTPRAIQARMTTTPLSPQAETIVGAHAGAVSIRAAFELAVGHANYWTVAGLKSTYAHAAKRKADEIIKRDYVKRSKLSKTALAERNRKTKETKERNKAIRDAIGIAAAGGIKGGVKTPMKDLTSGEVAAYKTRAITSRRGTALTAKTPKSGKKPMGGKAKKSSKKGKSAKKSASIKAISRKSNTCCMRLKGCNCLGYRWCRLLYHP